MIFCDPEHGEEAGLIVSPSGCQLRTNAGRAGEKLYQCDYVRVVSPAGREVGYWDHEEWRDDPAVVMGAIMGALSGVEIETNERKRIYCLAHEHFPDEGLVVLSGHEVPAIVDTFGEPTGFWADGVKGLLSIKDEEEARTTDDVYCREHPDSDCEWRFA
jgi:hypothetical protein